MSLKESARAERQKFKEIRGFKKKAGYIWDYYRFFIIGSIVTIALVYSLGSTIYHNIKFQEVFYCAIFNNYITDEQLSNLVDDFSDYYKINPENQYATIDDGFSYGGSLATQSDYASIEKIGAMISAKMVDCMAGNDDIIGQYAIDGALYDLETLLPADIYAAISDAVCWYSPASGGEERPYTIDLSKTLKKELFYTDSPRLGVVINSEHTDAAVAFIQYLFGL